MQKAIIGRKVGMTQIFDAEGKVIPVTVIEAGPCSVVMKKTADSDGYEAVQLGYDDIAERKLNKPKAGHLKKAGVSAKRILKEFTDARTLGIAVPVRESGDVAGSTPVKLVGPAGEIELKEGAIAAKRHIHMTPEDAAKYGFQDKEIVSVTVEGDRALTFDEVVLRVSEKFSTAMHVDTDEANAAGLAGTVYGTVNKK